MSVVFPKSLIFSLVVLITFVVKAIPLVNSDFFAVWQAWLPLAYWILGWLAGYVTFFADRIVDVYFTNPETELSVYAKKYFREKEYVKGWKLIMHNKKLQQKLTFRSALFHAVWMMLAFFTITSTQNLFGIGFVLAIGIHLLIEIWADYLLDKIYLKRWLFWQINRQFTDNQLNLYIWGSTFITFLLIYSSL